MKLSHALAGLVSALSIPILALTVLRAGRTAFDIPVELDPFDIDLQLHERNDG